MKNKKRTYIVVAILLAIVALGIGYATVSSMLEITGTATALESDGVKLEFTGTPSTTGGQNGTAAAINGSDSTKATCTVVLKTYNESATCTYTITNSTTDASISAKNISVAVTEDDHSTTWSGSSSEYFTITSNVGASTLAHNATTTATVTVTLKKENTTGDDITETFYVDVLGETDQS